MNKKGLIDVTSKLSGLTKKDTEIILNALTESIEDSLARHEKVTLVGFGSFNITTRKARIGRNPQTQEKIEIPEKNVVKFKPSKNLKEAVENG